MTSPTSATGARSSLPICVRRTLEFAGYDVKHVMNITDVEDKIIKRVQEQQDHPARVHRPV